MRVCVLVVIAVLALGISLYAEETTRGNYSVPESSELEEYLNTTEDFSHSHGYNDSIGEEIEDGLEVGAKVLFGQGVISQNQYFEAEGTRDFNNDTWNIKGLVTFDLR